MEKHESYVRSPTQTKTQLFKSISACIELDLGEMDELQLGHGMSRKENHAAEETDEGSSDHTSRL